MNGSKKTLFTKSIRISQDSARSQIEPAQIRIDITPQVNIVANQTYEIYIPVSKI
jgi:hypothetical protein